MYNTRGFDGGEAPSASGYPPIPLATMRRTSSTGSGSSKKRSRSLLSRTKSALGFSSSSSSSKHRRHANAPTTPTILPSKNRPYLVAERRRGGAAQDDDDDDDRPFGSFDAQDFHNEEIFTIDLNKRDVRRGVKRRDLLKTNTEQMLNAAIEVRKDTLVRVGNMERDIAHAEDVGGDGAEHLGAAKETIREIDETTEAITPFLDKAQKDLIYIIRNLVKDRLFIGLIILVVISVTVMGALWIRDSVQGVNSNNGDSTTVNINGPTTEPTTAAPSTAPTTAGPQSPVSTTAAPPPVVAATTTLSPPPPSTTSAPASSTAAATSSVVPPPSTTTMATTSAPLTPSP